MTKFTAIGAAFTLAVVLGLAGPAGAKVGAKCGAFPGGACGAHEFCEHPVGTCGLIGGEGTCVRVPHVCPMMIVDPQCGCNWKTYSNGCMRQMARQSEAHPGKCWQ
jgi:Kazal-type serine protease inhibitor domain